MYCERYYRDKPHDSFIKKRENESLKKLNPLHRITGMDVTTKTSLPLQVGKDFDIQN